MRRCFVFHHGFLMDKNYWQNILPYFKGEQYILLDAGYYGQKVEAHPEDGIEYIGVGHSLGVIKLLQTGFKFKHIIGLNSFLHFCPKHGDQLAQFYKNFAKNKLTAVKMFWRTSGIKYVLKSIHKLKLDVLSGDAALLKQNFKSAELPPSLFISSTNDPVITPSMTHYNFDAMQNVKLLMLADGAHVLGYVKPEVIYRHIIEFINS